jgi:hypothetical protein
MSSSITTSHVRQYSANVMHLCQQKGSRLRGTVMTDTVTGEAAFYDRLAKTAAIAKTTRHMDTPQIDQDHSRRMLVPSPFVWADLIDVTDRVRMLTDPTSPYVQNGAWAMGRKIDDIIVTAADATAATGKTGTGTQAFDTNMVVDVQVGGSSSDVGLNVTKLRYAKELLDAREVDEEEERFVILNAKQLRNLLGQTEVTSSDFNTVKALVQGDINTFLGFNFVRSERIGVDANADHKVLFYARSAIMLGVGQEPTIRVSERADKNYSTQVYLEMDLGAVRLDEDKVGYIECDPT